MGKRIYILLLILSFSYCKVNKNVHNPPTHNVGEKDTKQQTTPNPNELNKTEPDKIYANQNSTQNISNLDKQNNLDNTTNNTEKEINNTNIINNTNAINNTNTINNTENYKNENIDFNRQNGTINKENKININQETIDNKTNINETNENINNELNENKKEIIKNNEKEQNINTNINELNKINKQELNGNDKIEQNVKSNQNNRNNILEPEVFNSGEQKNNNINKYKPIKEKIKIMIKKNLLDIHKELKKYIPYPYDYIISFFIGFFFMGLFIFSKSSIQIMKQKSPSDLSQNVIIINKKIKEISQLHEKFQKKENNKPGVQNNNWKKINLSKFDELQNKLNELSQFVNIRNSEFSNENILRENICTLQMEIMTNIDNMMKK